MVLCDMAAILAGETAKFRAALFIERCSSKNTFDRTTLNFIRMRFCAFSAKNENANAYAYVARAYPYTLEKFPTVFGLFPTVFGSFPTVLGWFPTVFGSNFRQLCIEINLTRKLSGIQRFTLNP